MSITVRSALKAGAIEAQRMGWSRREWLERVQKAYMDMRGHEHARQMPSRQHDTIEERTLLADELWIETGGRT